MKKNKGLTLIELIISMVITSILVGVISQLISGPMQGYTESVARMQLIQMADVAFMRIARDVQSTVPNSLRVTDDGSTIEMVPVITAARYRSAGTNALTFAAPQSSFNILVDYATLESQLANYTATRIPTDGQIANVLTPNLYPGLLRLVIYNVGQYDYLNGTTIIDYDQPLPGINLYNPNAYDGSFGAYPAVDSHVITPESLYFTFTDPNVTPAETNIAFSDDLGVPITFQFALPSPKNTLYFVEGPVSYTCDGSNLWRYADYPLQSIRLNYTGLSTLTPPQMTVQALPLADHVIGCSFQYEQASDLSTGILNITLTLSDSIADVTMTLFKQIRVKNVL